MAAKKNAFGSVTLILGEEEFLADRAVTSVTAEARAQDPDTEVRELTPDRVAAGELAELVQPSLFGDRRVVVVRSAQELTKESIPMVTSYLAAPVDDVALVLAHSGKARQSKQHKALMDAATAAGARTIECPKITKPRERIDFVRAEVHGAGRVISDDAARALVDAVGNDLRELANACGQLVADTSGPIDEQAVARYHQGRAEVSGFTIADRAVEGKTAEALEQLRWALGVGVSPVLITSALGQGLRALAKVGARTGRAGSRGGGGSPARELGMPPWKVDRVRQQLRGWGPEGVSVALQAVAEADAQVKGGGVDAEYALERAILAITAARQH